VAGTWGRNKRSSSHRYVSRWQCPIVAGGPIDAGVHKEAEMSWLSGVALLLALSGCTAGRAVPPDPIYCYRTLADVSCYAEPYVGREGRLVGVWFRTPESHPPT
jgi:hypothetical protein